MIIEDALLTTAQQTHGIEIVSGLSKIKMIIQRLERECHQEVMAMHPFLREADQLASEPLNERSLSRGVRMRELLASDGVPDNILNQLKGLTERGHEARLSAGVQQQMLIVNRSTALLELQHEANVPRAALITDTLVLNS